MSRPLAVLVLAAWACACASKKAAGGDVAGVAMAAELSAHKLRAAVDHARDECAALEDRIVPWEEQQFFGAPIAMGHAKQGRGLLDPKSPVQAYVQVVGLHVASASRKPGITWTFGVVDDPAPKIYTAMGGYALVTTGLLAAAKNEAELAAALAVGIARVVTADVSLYSRARLSACNIAVTGYYLVEAGSTDVAGGETFIRDSKFGATMRAFAIANPFDVGDARVDRDFVAWFTNRVIEFQLMAGYPAEQQEEIARTAFELLSRSGYEASVLAPLLTQLDPARSSGAVAALQKLPVPPGGKQPAFPKGLELTK